MQTQIEADCKRLISTAVAKFGRLDVLVCNAGVRSYQKVTEATEESWDEILGVNVYGYAFCAKAAIPEMIACGAKGSIVNVASHRSLVAGPNTVSDPQQI
eukprot:SAG11_NODE_1114_length_5808_cov_12.177965_2_plen_100_part_00